MDKVWGEGGALLHAVDGLPLALYVQRHLLHTNPASDQHTYPRAVLLHTNPAHKPRDDGADDGADSTLDGRPKLTKADCLEPALKH